MSGHARLRGVLTGNFEYDQDAEESIEDQESNGDGPRKLVSPINNVEKKVDGLCRGCSLVRKLLIRHGC